MKISPIIQVNELLPIFKNSNVLIFDVSNHKNAKANFEKEHLEGAFFVDLNSQLADIKEDLSGGRHPLPKAEDFAETLTSLGITKNHHIVIYDDKNGSNAAARFWWMLRSAQHEKVQVLNGGIIEAKKQGLPLSSGIETVKNISERYEFDKWDLPTVTIDEVEIAAQNPDYLVIDVREKDRYNGIIEPIDLIAGHIPGAINIPFSENLDSNGLFLKPNELKSKYATIFGEMDCKNIVVHCGSGVTACHTILSLDYAGLKIPNLYVGSWGEWSRSNKKIEKPSA